MPGKAPADIRSLARSHTTTAINTLASLMKNKNTPPNTRVRAAEVLLNRGWGPPMPQDKDGEDLKGLIINVFKHDDEDQSSG